jgi:branched-chain amino acid transport system permease protein
MNLYIEAVIFGILTGGVYALMASGLTLIFGVLDIINIAQGAMVILGAYLSYALAQNLHLDLFLGLLITMPVMFVLGVLIHAVFIRPLKQNRTSLSILVTFGIMLVIQGLLTIYFTTTTRKLQAPYVTQSIQIGDFYLGYIYIYAFLLSAVLLGLLYLLVYRTRFGQSLRASIQNRTAAELIGIDVNRVASLTFGIGVALTAAGGMAYGATTSFDPNSGLDLISRLLVIIVLGGMGSLSGALIAAVSLLIIEDVTAVIWSPTWSVVVAFALMIVVLVLRPQGLLGKLEGRRQ